MQIEEACIVLKIAPFKQIINHLQIDSTSKTVSEILFSIGDDQLTMYTFSFHDNPLIRTSIDFNRETIESIASADDDNDDLSAINPDMNNKFIIAITNLKHFLKSSENGHLLLTPNFDNKIMFFVTHREMEMVHTADKIDKEVDLEIFNKFFDNKIPGENNRCTINIANLRHLFSSIPTNKNNNAEVKIYVTDNNGQQTRCLIAEVSDGVSGPNVFLISNRESDVNDIEGKMTPFDDDPVKKLLKRAGNHIGNSKKRKHKEYNRISNELTVPYTVFKHALSNLMEICKEAELVFSDKYLKIIMPFDEGKSECIIRAKEVL